LRRLARRLPWWLRTHVLAQGRLALPVPWRWGSALGPLAEAVLTGPGRARLHVAVRPRLRRRLVAPCERWRRPVTEALTQLFLVAGLAFRRVAIEPERASGRVFATRARPGIRRARRFGWRRSGVGAALLEL